jgi:hypothetical protein
MCYIYQKPIWGHKQLHMSAPKKGDNHRITECDKNLQNTRTPKAHKEHPKKTPPQTQTNHYFTVIVPLLVWEGP